MTAVSVYQLTLGDQVSSNEQQAAAEVVPLEVPEETVEGVAQFEEGEIFAKLYVPRFGENYVRNIGEGTSLTKVLDKIGLGHYAHTQMPDEIGNFALAGHRSGNGGPLRDIDKLVAGDQVFVQTATTWYTYQFLEHKIVSPQSLGVIRPVPEGLTVASSGNKYLTLTSCTPIYVNTERYVVWFELVSEQAVSSGEPVGLR